jgi:hypothetical protein
MEGYDQPVPPVPQPQDLPASPMGGGQGGVGFPSPQNHPEEQSKGGIMKWIIALIVIVIIIAGGIFAIRNFSGGESTDDASPTPNTLSSFATPTSTPTPTAAATPTPKPKSEVKVQILNGTGKAGEASFLKDEMEKLGYSDIEAANADSQDETVTTFSFDKDLSDDYVTEITKKLEEIYQDVRVRRSSLTDFDVSILTGPRKGTSATSESPTPSGSATPTASPTSSPES